VERLIPEQESAEKIEAGCTGSTENSSGKGNLRWRTQRTKNLSRPTRAERIQQNQNGNTQTIRGKKIDFLFEIQQDYNPNMEVTTLSHLFDLLKLKIVYDTLNLARKYKIMVGEVTKSHIPLGSYL
jgi:hypothetical protein